MSTNNIEGQMSLDGLDELNLREADAGAPPAAEDMTPDNPEDVRNGVYMFVVRVEGDDVHATPVLFTMGETGAEPVEDAPADPDDFYALVAEDMGELLVALVGRTEESGMSKSDAMLQLLTDMQKQPQELVHNILATIIVEAACDKE